MESFIGFIILLYCLEVDSLAYISLSISSQFCLNNLIFFCSLVSEPLSGGGSTTFNLILPSEGISSNSPMDLHNISFCGVLQDSSILGKSPFSLLPNHAWELTWYH